MIRYGKGAAALAGLLALAACSGGPQPLAADGGWVRLAAVKGRPAAGYLTIHGGPKDETLISVSCDVAIRAEMHGPNMMPLAAVPVPAHAAVAFAPKGRHVMLFDLNPAILPGGRLPRLLLTFADGTRLAVPAAVVKAGDPAPET